MNELRKEEQMIRVLFVDDEPNVLNGLRRILRPLRDQWDMAFLSSGTEALQFADATPCDVIVSDMKMPGMDGAEFFSEIRERHPEAIRIALSGETDNHMIYRCVEHAHQYVAKPCDMDTLVLTVQRASKLRELMADDALQSLVSRLSTVPSMPQQYRQVVRELQAEIPSLQKIADVIEIDAGMATKIVQLVNSAFFGLARRVSSPAQAAVYLGLDVIKALVLSTGVFSQFAESRADEKLLERIWSRSLGVAGLARQIALEHSGEAVVADHAYTGGLLLDIGKLIFAANLPEKFSLVEDQAASSGQAYVEIERQIIGHSHSAVGGYLAGLWGLPDPVVECIAFHREPGFCEPGLFPPVAAVHIAHVIVASDGQDTLEGLDREFVARLCLSERVARYQAAWQSSQRGERGKAA